MSRHDDHEDVLEHARTRDLLGLHNTHLPVEERVLARVLNRIDAGDAAEVSDVEASRSAPSGRPFRGARSWFALAASVAAVGVVTATVVLPASPAIASPPQLRYSVAAPEDVETAPPAQAVLTDLAATAARVDIPGTGTVQYIALRAWNTSSNDDVGRATIRPIEQEAWMAADDSGVVIQRAGPELLPNGELDPDPVTTADDVVRDAFVPGDFPDVTASLPRDPDELREALVATMPESCLVARELEAACLVAEVGVYSTGYLIPSDLAAATWQMLAADPHVHTLGTAIDRAGREVTAVAAPPRTIGFGTSIDVLLIDPATGRLVGTEDVTLETTYLDIDGPTVTSFTTLLDARWVETVEGR